MISEIELDICRDQIVDEGRKSVNVSDVINKIALGFFLTSSKSILMQFTHLD